MEYSLCMFFNVNCDVSQHRRVLYSIPSSILSDCLECLFMLRTLLVFAANPHYRVVDSYVQNGRRSTLIVRGAVDTDFGVYTCSVENEMGVAEMQVELAERREDQSNLGRYFFCSKQELEPHDDDL